MNYALFNESTKQLRIPIGILVKRYIKFKYSINLSHYGISIIRDKGIDENAVFWILKNHPKCEIQFIDGWTGKGMINTALNDGLNAFSNSTRGISDRARVVLSSVKQGILTGLKVFMEEKK